MRAYEAEQAVHIPVGEVTLDGDLWLPPEAAAVVVFAHGSGSSRLSPRNRLVAGELRDSGLGTLLMDLLTDAEEQIDLRTRQLRFDISLLAERLVGATKWLRDRGDASGPPVGYFGASTGGAAALEAAALLPEEIGAVVSRGGRPDLAEDLLDQVGAPTLLIVGALDTTVLELNHHALDRMRCTKALEVVEGASHLFEEPGKLEVVARLARDWFTKYLVHDAGKA